MYRMIDNDEIKKIDPQSRHFAGSLTIGGTILEPNINIRKMLLINESGLYQAIFNSRLPSAKAFKKWVTSEVLPSIRKHGGYLTPELTEEALLDPDRIIALATALKESRAKAARLEAEFSASLF